MTVPTSTELQAHATRLGAMLLPAQFPVRQLWAARVHPVAAGNPVAPAGPMPLGRTWTAAIATDNSLSAVRVWLHTFGTTTAEVRLSLVRLEDGTETQVASEHLSPAIDRVWYELQPTLAPPGRYELRVTTLAGTAAPAHIDGGQPESIAWAADTVELTPLEVTAEDGWIVLGVEPDCHLALELPWRRDGYSVLPEDGVCFDTIISRGGRYLPAQELKRMSAWPFTIEDTEVSFLSGDGGFTLAADNALTVTGRMSEDTMTVTVVSETGRVRLRTGADRARLTESLPRFTASDARFADRLTRFYRERALSWPFRDYTASAAGWRHWMTRVLSWTGTDGSAAQATDLAETRQDEQGWVWTRTDCPGWPFPDPVRYDTRHPSASLSFVSAVATHYGWTGDEAFLAAQLPRARRALDHIVADYGVREHHLLVNHIPDQDGQPGSLGSHYWDIVPGGHKDAYANVLLYAALAQAARLELHVGESERAADLANLADRVRTAFEDEFWNDAAGWFVQNIDVTGTVHDYGASYLNLEALAVGLGTPQQVRRIIDWLDTGSTELTDRVLLAAPCGESAGLVVGERLVQEFTTDRAFATVAALITAADPSASFQLTLQDAEGVDLASHRFGRWWDRGWAPLPVGERGPGSYRLVAQAFAPGLGWQRSTPTATEDPELAIAAVTGPRPGPADIYEAWGFAPRATTRRNDFWYTFGWSGVETRFGDQVQDGGTSLYISGFDIEARARISPDLAWQRLTAILDRVDDPDRLCGGGPLYRGEIPQAMLPGQVGVDNPFPESGLVPAAALPAFLGLDPTADGLVIRPSLPGALRHFGIDNLHWRGLRLSISAERMTVTVRSEDDEASATIRPGGTVRLSRGESGRLQLHHFSTSKGHR